MISNYGAREDSWEFLEPQGDKPSQFKGNPPWILTGRTGAEAEAPILWSPKVNSQLTGKDPDTEKDWRQKEKRVTENEMAEWHHWFSEHELGQTLGDGEEQGGLLRCSPWGCKKSDMTWQLNNNKHFCNTEDLAYNTQMTAAFSQDSWTYFPSYPCCSKSLVTDAPHCFLFLLDSGSGPSLHLEAFHKSWCFNISDQFNLNHREWGSDISIFYLFLLKYSWLQFCVQLYSKMIQLYIYFFRFFSLIGYFKTLNAIPCAIQ